MPHQGLALKLERVRARVTQTRLAEHVERAEGEGSISRQWVTKYERLEKVPPAIVRRYRIALLKCADITEDVA